MEDRNIYALLVGIDKYQPPVPALQGCINDMLAMKHFLENRVKPGFLHLEVLTDEEASRMNIVEKFETHLTKAGKGDVALFYFVGHGSQEKAHEIFWPIEPDKKNETIVCYDSRMHDGMDMADKELATLIDMVAQNDPHIVVIMDCCHSGSGSRSDSENDPEAEFWPRQSPDSELLRSLDSYILPRNISHDRSAFATADQQFVVPQGRHVTLSAAQSFQLAKETMLSGQRRGVFTYSLIEVLQNSSGDFTYDDIMRRVRSLVSQRTYDQTPVLYAVEGEDIQMPFLGGTVKEKRAYYIADYHQDDGWVMDGGIVHGIPIPIGTSTSVVGLYPEGTAFEDMGESNLEARMEVTFADVSRSILKQVGGELLNTTKSYYVKILEIPIQPLKVCIRGNSGEGIQLAEKALQQSHYSFYLEQVSNSKEADFNLIAKTDIGTDPARIQPGYMINRASDKDSQPLVEQISGLTSGTAIKAIEDLNHIARWKRILEVKNPNSNIDPESVKIMIYPPDSDDPYTPEEEGYVFSFKEDASFDDLPRMRIKIVNQGHRPLHCALVYMGSQFGIKTQLFGEDTVFLNEGQDAWVLNGQAIPMKIADPFLAMGKHEVQEIFKLIISSQAFNASSLQQKALNLPKPQMRDKPEMNVRSLIFPDTNLSPKSDWNTNELMISVRLDT